MQWLKNLWAKISSWFNFGTPVEDSDKDLGHEDGA